MKISILQQTAAVPPQPALTMQGNSEDQCLELPGSSGQISSTLNRTIWLLLVSRECVLQRQTHYQSLTAAGHATAIVPLSGPVTTKIKVIKIAMEK